MKGKKSQVVIFALLAAILILGGIALIFSGAQSANTDRIVLGALTFTVGGIFGKFAIMP